ncbi:MAG: SpoIIE family protein phosphatase [Saprospiraceae bacterium]|jgi:sigma-B regulation protein RsbU (phosphoserine phosphatase)|nr:SpoIIE family protein phosphatase [Candidatus Vicinibacter proximus]MBL7822355.1 SpoIIE family protein phosphatase [Saprospiraceae bacterium]MCC6843107.1 SpoIIE family protein phosphatase [Saprospiraceae bacterium]HRG32005.1 SpoIIE family protein phosphatase [Saprospiraceae bacterium]
MNREQGILTKMQNELSLKQLQITSLLNITQAINENLPQEDLFNMYKNFLTWELSIEKIALFIRENNSWNLCVEFNINPDVKIDELPNLFLQFTRLHTIKPQDDPRLQEFEFIIPVYHKKQPIAYSLISGVKRSEDVFNNIQFITSITNIIAVAIENKILVRGQIVQEKEMEFANEVTQMLIPAKMPSGTQYQLANVYRPHYKVGGDYIDFIKFSENKILFCIADVSGKGMAAAMIMANFQALVQNLGQQYRDLETLVIALNQTVSRMTKGEKYLTFFIAIADIKQNMLYYVNAGHIPPLLIKGKETTELKATTTIIGHFENLPEINEGIVRLDEDVTLIAFTDGLVDIKNRSGKNYNTEMLKRHILENKMLNAEQTAGSVMDEVLKFREDQEVPDDIAILVFKFYKDEK